MRYYRSHQDMQQVKIPGIRVWNNFKTKMNSFSGSNPCTTRLTLVTSYCALMERDTMRINFCWSPPVKYLSKCSALESSEIKVKWLTLPSLYSYTNGSANVRFYIPLYTSRIPVECGAEYGKKPTIFQQYFCKHDKHQYCMIGCSVNLKLILIKLSSRYPTNQSLVCIICV